MDTPDRSLPPYLSPLPVGVDPLPPELIASRRRERILTAAIEVFATRGYRATKTDHLAAASPTALATFYTVFEDKQDCLLQAYDRILAESREQLEAAIDATSPWSEQVRSALRALLELIAAEPHRARLLLVEAQAAGEAGQARYEATLEDAVLFLRCARAADPLANQRPGTFETAIVAGLSWLLHLRLTTGEVEGIEALLPELEQFVLEPYLYGGRPNHRREEPPGDPHANGASSDGLRPVPEQQPPGEEPIRGLPRLPPGRHGLPRSFIIQNQRDRLSAGIIAVVAEHGYHDATVARIAKAAGVSRRTFYTCFSSKEDCFLDTYDLLAEHLVEAMEAATQGVGEEWPELLGARLDALLGTFAANPDLVPFLIAPLGARGKLPARYRDFLDALLAILTESGPLIADRPCEAVEQSLIGGLIGLIARQVRAGEGERLPELAGDLCEFFLVPFLGPDALAPPLDSLEAAPPLAVLAEVRPA